MSWEFLLLSEASSPRKTGGSVQEMPRTPAWGFPKTNPQRVKHSIRQGSTTPQEPGRKQTRRPNPGVLSQGVPVTSEEAQRCQLGSWTWRAVQCRRLMDGFLMRALCRLPAVPVQPGDQHGCTLPSHMYREHHTSHEQQLICVGDSPGQTRPGSCQQVAEPCLPPLDGHALDTRSLPASDATSLPSSATLGIGKQWGYSGDELRADRYRFKSQLCH